MPEVKLEWIDKELRSSCVINDRKVIVFWVKKFGGHWANSEDAAASYASREVAKMAVRRNQAERLGL